MRHQCRPVRDLLVDYLRERQASVDYVTLVRLADTLGRLFWADLEAHHPGSARCALTPRSRPAWKQRILTKTIRRRQPDGSLAEIASPRESATNCLTAVRSFYLDIAQWAIDDPARWGPWAVPCPVKARRDPAQEDRRPPQVPHGPADPRAAARPPRPGRRDRTPSARTAAERLAAAKAAAPGEVFTVGGQTLRRRSPPAA